MSEEKDYPRGEEPASEGDGPNLRYDDFVGRIVQDPNDPPGVTLLSGYLGSSSEEGHVRLYLDEELSRYVEIPERAIRHAQELPPEQSPLGGSLVWIDRDAEVVHGAAGSERRRATFLEGQIAQDFMGAAAGGIDALSGSTQARECFVPPTASGPVCGTSKTGPCIPPTEFVGCRTRTGIVCTRLGPNCGRTSYDPVCTIAGPNCHTLVFFQCQPSALAPCVTHDIACQASGFVPCNPPVDFTIWQGQQGQFGHPAAHYATKPTDVTCVPHPSVHCHTHPGVDCPEKPTVVTCVGHPSVHCHTYPGVGCPEKPTVVTCVGPGATPPTVMCPTFAACPSAVDACPTHFGCPGPGGGGGGAMHAFHANPLSPTMSPACLGIAATHFCVAAPPPTQARECATLICPSNPLACQSHLYRCPTATCPTHQNICNVTKTYGCLVTIICPTPPTMSDCPTTSPACRAGGGS
ncbi:MAG: hypothetical protein JOZ96_27410 [Acidobacteria bacterium]|nr:hypothetical protein [Acidobacteriota bacterium]